MTNPTDPVLIDKAIDSYADRSGSGAGSAAPYDSASLAEIYAPRVQQLFDLQNQGYKYAQWKWDDKAGHNRWHGVTDGDLAQTNTASEDA